MNLLDLPGLLDLLDYEPGERITINTQPPGGRFATRTTRVEDVTGEQPDDLDVWWGVCPVRAGTSGRGKAEDVTRLPALWADLDVKPGGCPDMETARAIVDGLSLALHVRPVAVTYSGHGLQPLWAIDPEDGAIDDDNRARMQTLLRRWGRLVAHVAEVHKSNVDSVYDLPRILRTPGSTNNKEPDNPVAVLTLTDTGRPLTVEEILDALEAHGVPEMDGDDTVLGEVVTDPNTWTHANHTCSYASRTIKSWATEKVDARHPWLVSCMVRLAAMHAHGCITQADLDTAKHQVANRFRDLLTDQPARKETPGEIAEAWSWGIARTATMPAERIARELGNHPHLAPADPRDPFNTGLPPTGTDPSPRPVKVVEPVNVAKVGETYGPTEDGTARALVRLHGHEMRYCPQRGLWLIWAGSKWEWDERERHRELIKGIARSLPDGEGWASYKKRALSAAGITGISRQAQSDPDVTVALSDLDANPYQLNTPGGIIDLQTGELKPADPMSLHTRSTSTTPDFDRSGELLHRFLHATFQDEELVGFVQRVLGLAAIGKVLEQILPFGYGSGANGKSTLLETAMHAFGMGDGGYAISAPSEMLMVRKYSEHPAEIAQLAGARLVVLSELEEGARFAEARIKQLTGSDSINARFMARNPFTFTPTHTFFLLGNSQPAATTGGDAFWRRLRLIPFSHTVPEHERDPRLGEKLAEESAAFLAWVARGAADYLSSGSMRTPQAISAATAEYARDQDTVGRFVDDRLILTPAGHVPMRDVRHAYEAWCSDTGEAPVSAKRLGSELRRRWGLTESRTASTKSYLGAILAADESVTDEPDTEWYR